jgi:hypothetical protein
MSYVTLRDGQVLGWTRFPIEREPVPGIEHNVPMDADAPQIVEYRAQRAAAADLATKRAAAMLALQSENLARRASEPDAPTEVLDYNAAVDAKGAVAALIES